MRAHEHGFLALERCPRCPPRHSKGRRDRACLYNPDLSEIYEGFTRHRGFVLTYRRDAEAPLAASILGCHVGTVEEMAARYAPRSRRCSQRTRGERSARFLSR
jgi:hypothetical protein